MLIDNILEKNYKQLKNEVDALLSKSPMIFKDDDFELISKVLCSDERNNVQKLGLKLSREKEKFLNEVNRVKKMYDFDRSYASGAYLIGVDEVGRGPFAGPIVAAAVILTLNNLNDEELILGINDSKKLSVTQRETLSDIIKKKAISYKIIEISNEDIDNRGLGWANNEVLRLAALSIKENAGIVLSDGFPVRGLAIKNEHVVKGDAKSATIACASIIAKVHRDKLMNDLDKIYPEYGFSKNAGYGTAEHIKAINSFGITSVHRKSFLKNIINRN